MANEAEEILKRLALNKGVTGVIVVNPEGIPVRSTLENKVSVNYAGLVSELCDKARSVIKDLDPKNEFTFLRIRSMKNEIMVAPDKDYILIVIQEPVD